jgi:hypothetical protein
MSGNRCGNSADAAAFAAVQASSGESPSNRRACMCRCDVCVGDLGSACNRPGCRGCRTHHKLRCHQAVSSLRARRPLASLPPWCSAAGRLCDRGRLLSLGQHRKLSTRMLAFRGDASPPDRRSALPGIPRGSRAQSLRNPWRENARRTHRSRRKSLAPRTRSLPRAPLAGDHRERSPAASDHRDPPHGVAQPWAESLELRLYARLAPFSPCRRRLRPLQRVPPSPVHDPLRRHPRSRTRMGNPRHRR